MCYYFTRNIPKKSIAMNAKIEDYQELWQNFFERQALMPQQQEQFLKYYSLLLASNDIHNLTAITNLSSILADHFEDSLALRLFYDCKTISMLSDIGTGAGFPSIPLKIVFPHLGVVALEVNHKKREFLQTVIQELQLDNVVVSELDWRTFLRKTDYPIDLFCARASLQPEELLRVFKPSSPYKDAQLVYWASQHWISEERIASFITREESYIVGSKKRKLVFFKAPAFEPNQ
jgi:16S rRNA (guanine527-N7)-methyltransferase